MESELEKIVVLGGGPIGIETALYARRLGYPTEVFERGHQVAANVLRWHHVQLFSPFEMNCSPLGIAELNKQDPTRRLPEPDQLITGKQWIEDYLLPLSQTEWLNDVIRCNHRVDLVGRNRLQKGEKIGSPSRAADGFRIIGQRDGRERSDFADVVIDTTGTYGNPNYLGGGSAPAIGELKLRSQIEPANCATESLLKNGITFELPDFAASPWQWANRKFLVIGGGYSAATNVVNLCALAAQTRLEIDWVTHGPGKLPANAAIESDPIPRIENDSLDSRDRLAEAANQAVRTESVHWHPCWLIDEITDGAKRRFAVRFQNQDQLGRHQPIPETREYDFVIANVGFHPEHQLLSGLQVQNCYATDGIMKLAGSLLSQCHADCTKIKPSAAETLKTTEPNLYVIGSKSYGRNSSFLFANGLEQIKQVFSMISNRADLDLYQAQISSS